MQPETLLSALLPPRVLPLWAPLLSFYRPSGSDPPALDLERCLAHARNVAEHVPLWMIGGSTGDGWELSDAQWTSWLELAASQLRLGPSRVLAAILRPTTEQVLQRLESFHQIAGTRPRATLVDNVRRLRALGWIGICVCPPVGKELTQDQIIEHVETILEHARVPLALYQLPQVTECRIQPATFRELCRSHPEIILFKDSSGEDQVAQQAPPWGGPLLVRGAETDYARSLRAMGGRYDGLLLSTANVFGAPLRTLVRAALGGEASRALELSAELESIVGGLFSPRLKAVRGNPFANVNRAAAHVLSHGRHWREHPAPLLFDGSRLPTDVLEGVSAILEKTRLVERPEGFGDPPAS